VVEQRRYARSPINLPLEFSLKDSSEARSGTGKDISVGGMFVEAASPAPFGATVTIQLRLPGHKEQMVLPGVVRWTRQGGMGIQFGLVGARDTHAITEIVKTTERR
jgi:Tfp pilus assembly protein PilZ